MGKAPPPCSIFELFFVYYQLLDLRTLNYVREICLEIDLAKLTIFGLNGKSHALKMEKNLLS
jgi:hypothetical protein